MSEEVTDLFQTTSVEARLGLTDADIQLLTPQSQLTREDYEELSERYVVLQWEHQNYTNGIVDEDDDAEDWKSLDKIEDDREKRFKQARYLVRKCPHVKRTQNLYQYYILGNKYRPSVAPIIEDYDELDESDEKKHKKIAKQVDKAWKTFRRENRRSWTPAEKLSRAIRDGEVITWIKDREWPPAFRFKDPEEITDGKGDSGTKGIKTDPNDVTVPLHYQVYDSERGEVVQEIGAEDITHWKINVDSNEKRGRTQYESTIDIVRQLMSLVHNEVTHRTAQSAIVLIRKVAGRNKPRQLADNAYTSTTSYPEREISREKLRAGSIITSSNNVEYEFAQPQGNFSDATPLITLLVSHLSAATGWTIAQITTDPSGGNFASSMVNESPVLQMIEYWQGEFADNMDEEFRIVVDAALEAGEIEYEGDDFWEEYTPEYHFPRVANISPKDNAQVINLGIVNRTLSRAEGRRQLGLDDAKLNYELQKEDEAAVADMAAQINATGGSNPTMQNQRQTAQNNAGGGGTNQGPQGVDVQHRDRKGTTG